MYTLIFVDGLKTKEYFVNFIHLIILLVQFKLMIKLYNKAKMNISSLYLDFFRRC